MDTLTTIAFAREIIDIDSTTGQEDRAGRWIAARLRTMGYHVVEQQLDRGCANVLATLDPPEVVLSTHFDCVPPFFPSEVRDGTLYGRGACDAKGIVAAQVAAVEQLRVAGERRVGLLFVAGEERGSDGAAAANELPNTSRFLINGEPTDNRLAIATRGVLRVRLHATGRAAHSSTPERGISAIDRLLDALIQLRSLELPHDDLLGTTHYNIGLIDGGVAHNVVSPHASAEVLFRTVGDTALLLARLAALQPLVRVEELLHIEAIRMHTVPGFDTAVFPFTTDVPLLDRWGAPLLFGPGSILVAHTDHEHLPIAELERAVDGYITLARSCLGHSGASPRA